MGLTEARPAYRITANDADITDAIQGRFKSLRITDESGMQSDLLEIALSDHDPKNPIKVPPTGAELQVWLGYRDQLARMGMFVCDEIELAGWPGILCIRGRAAIYEGTLKGKKDLQTQKVRSWPNNTKLGAMVAKIAKEHGMESVVADSLKSITLPHFDQTEESDISFLTRILKNYDAIAKPAGGKLVVTKRGEGKTASGDDMPVITVLSGQVSRFSMRLTRRESPGTVVAYWHANKRAKKQEIMVGNGEPVRRIRHYFPTQAAALQAASSELDRRKRGQHTVSLAMPGDNRLMAEARIILEGFREGVDGEWIIKRVEHELSEHGYKCHLEAEKPNQASA